MNLLKTYIREQVKAFVLEARANGVQLPEVPAAPRAGAVGRDTTVTKRVQSNNLQKIIEALASADNYAPRQIDVTSRRTVYRPFDAREPTDQTYATIVHDALENLSKQINSYTNNMDDPPTGINLSALNPQDSQSALSKVLEATKWAKSTSAVPPEADLLAVNNIVTNLPLIRSAVYDYMRFLST